MKNNTRFIGLDSLRVVMVICVIALHCGMTYMAYRPDWWYVADSQQGVGFTYLVIILDCFPMTALFFLSGYFAPPSFRKRGTLSFIKDKFMHIGVPWILGVLLVAPFFSRASFMALGYPSMPIGEYFIKYFFTSLYQQAHYWYLGILFVFFVVYALLPKKNNAITSVESDTSKSSSPFLLVSMTVLITLLAYYLSTKFYKTCNEWTNIGYVLYFQPARMIGYIAMFALGIYGNKKKWFTSEGWKPSVGYLAVGIIAIMGILYWKFFVVFKLSPDVNLIIDAVSYSFASVCMTFGLIGLFVKESSSSKYSISRIAPYSYGIYWLHQIVGMLIMNYLVNVNLPAIAKWSITMVLTVLLCALTTKYILKKAPLLKKIF